jgi:hypothetical protein
MGDTAMIWLTWRQFRSQAATALIALVVAAVVLGATGAHLRHLYDTSGIATCKASGDCLALESAFLAHYKLLRDLLGPILLVVPTLLGVFWGAPLLARELENGTYRLAWTQGVTRTRWLAVKVALVGLAAIAVTELFSLMVAWWFSPVDRVKMDRITPAVFDERGIVALGYAAFALALGVTAGTLVRRTLPAMATTLIVFVAARLAVTFWIRPHLVAPAHASAPLSSASYLNFVPVPSGVTVVAGTPSIPNAWVYSGRVVDNAGQPATTQVLHKLLHAVCPTVVPPPTSATGTRPAPEAFQACTARLSAKLHEAVLYQPGSRFWTLQVDEMAIFLALGLILIGVCFWWVRHRLS